MIISLLKFSNAILSAEPETSACDHKAAACPLYDVLRNVCILSQADPIPYRFFWRLVARRSIETEVQAIS